MATNDTPKKPAANKPAAKKPAASKAAGTPASTASTPASTGTTASGSTPPPATIQAGAPQPMLESDARTFAMLTHLSAILLMGMGLGFVGPLVFWLMYKDRSLLVAEHGKQELNLQISVLIWGLIATVGSLVTFGLGALVLIPALLVMLLVALIMQIMAAVAGYRGEYYNFGIAFTFIR